MKKISKILILFSFTFFSLSAHALEEVPVGSFQFQNYKVQKLQHFVNLDLRSSKHKAWFKELQSKSYRCKKAGLWVRCSSFVDLSGELSKLEESEISEKLFSDLSPAFSKDYEVNELYEADQLVTYSVKQAVQSAKGEILESYRMYQPLGSAARLDLVFASKKLRYIFESQNEVSALFLEEYKLSRFESYKLYIKSFYEKVAP